MKNFFYSNHFNYLYCLCSLYRLQQARNQKREHSTHVDQGQPR